MSAASGDAKALLLIFPGLFQYPVDALRDPPVLERKTSGRKGKDSHSGRNRVTTVATCLLLLSEQPLEAAFYGPLAHYAEGAESTEPKRFVKEP